MGGNEGSGERKTSTRTDLGGRWRVAPLSTELHRTGADPDLDDHAWETVGVPGHWGSTEAFADADGPRQT